MKGLITMAAFILIIVGFLLALPTPPDMPSTDAWNKQVISKQNRLSNNKSDDRKLSYKAEKINHQLIIKGASWFDGDTWHNDSPLIVIDGRVNFSSDLSEVLIDLPVIDFSGKYIIPGLIDAHTHTWGSALQQAVRFGVTTELDMFTQPTFVTQAKQQQSDVADRQQADIFSSGILATSEGGHGTEYGINIPTVDSPEQALEFVKQRLAEGSDYIKIVYIQANKKTPFTSISRDTLNALVKAAHQMNVMAVVHTSDYESAYHAVSAGADGLVHVFHDQLISNDLLLLMKQKNTFVIPTLSVISSMFGKAGTNFILSNSPLQDRLTPAIINQLEQSFDAHPSSKNALNIAQKNVQLMHQAGIDILVGTDAPNPGTAHGVSIHNEMQLLQQAGMPVLSILKAATSLPGKYFPVAKRGQLIDGARADFLVLSKNPMQSINNTQFIEHVYKNGYPINVNHTEASNIKLPAKLADFKHDLSNQLTSNPFFSTSDDRFQGNSTANIKWQNIGCDTMGSALITGSIGQSFPYPWAGAMLTFSENMEIPVDLNADYKQLEFNVSGTPGQYRLLVFTQGLQRPAEINYTISPTDNTCQQISVVFEQHSSINWELVTGLAWVANKEHKAFEFMLDDIHFKAKTKKH